MLSTEGFESDGSFFICIVILVRVFTAFLSHPGPLTMIQKMVRARDSSATFWPSVAKGKGLGLGTDLPSKCCLHPLQ